jgi:large subunit ribosomal protein L15
MPLYRRLPKRGFKDINSREIMTVNVSVLEKFEDGTTVDTAKLLESGAVSKTADGIKILGHGELTKKLTVRANAFSASAKEKIEKAGGTAEVIDAK